MQITCENCLKNFQVEDSLIPEKGRMLQCGGCQHQWFYSKNISIDKKNILNIEENEEIFDEKEKSENGDKELQKFIDKKENRQPHINKTKSLNYFNLFLLIIISLIALIVLIDTFKNQISFVYPNIDFVLNNLYESLNDIKLFIIDLIK
tara:strand:- start:962 stop:1408 length:447 start_codon:yes stop_codon:yes gene_type:complete